MDKIEIDDSKTLALKDFYQGEVIMDSLYYANSINHSLSPNAFVRNGRIIAWSCIKKGDQITIDWRYRAKN